MIVKRGSGAYFGEIYMKARENAAGIRLAECDSEARVRVGSKRMPEY